MQPFRWQSCGPYQPHWVTHLSDEQVSQLAYEVEVIHHGTPSGIDNSVITYAKPVYFEKGKMIEILQVKHPFTLVIGDTGVSKPYSKCSE